jgi:hypothetical protein
VLSFFRVFVITKKVFPQTAQILRLRNQLSFTQ